MDYKNITFQNMEIIFIALQIIAKWLAERDESKWGA
jgi:hypothetical protein